MGQQLSKSRTVFLLLMGAAAIWFFASHDSASDKPTDPATSTSLDGHAPLSAGDVAKRAATIRNVLSVEPPSDKNGNVFVVKVKQGSIFEGGNTSKDVLHTIGNHAGKTAYVGVEIDMVETLVDGYGRQSDVPILRLELSRDDVEKFNYDNILGWNVLNMAHVSSLNPVSTHIVEQECAPDSENAKYAPDFCQAAANAGSSLNAADASQ